MVKKICMLFCLFSAFLIVMAHTIIPHHHHELPQEHQHGNVHQHHSMHDHATNPDAEKDFDHNNAFSWFVSVQKKIEFSNDNYQGQDNSFPPIVLICFLSKKEIQNIYFKKIEYSPPEIIGGISSGSINTSAMRAPPYYLS